MTIHLLSYEMMFAQVLEKMKVGSDIMDIFAIKKYMLSDVRHAILKVCPGVNFPVFGRELHFITKPADAFLWQLVMQMNTDDVFDPLVCLTWVEVNSAGRISGEFTGQDIFSACSVLSSNPIGEVEWKVRASGGGC